MPTKAEFQQAFRDRLVNYPTVAQLAREQDPRVLAPLDAEATMLAMLSQQIDLAEYEPFTKVRDATILADATLKGILPLGRPAKVSLNVTNKNAAPYTLTGGRRLVDARGRIHVADATTVVAAGATVVCTLTQKTTRVVEFTAAPGGPFLRIPVPASTSGDFLCALQVALGEDTLEYRPDYFNAGPGDLIYQAETDEYRNMYVALGQDGVIGYEAQTGDVFTMTIDECAGLVDDLDPASSFNLEYVYTVPDGNLELKLLSIDDQGQVPPDIETLRLYARYPALYDHDAVYLGNFDFLFRRYLSPVRFLSVWNEQIEERVRGASLDSINRLFVAGTVDGMSNAVFEDRVTELARRADDSYKLQFVAVHNVPVPVTIVAKVSVVHDPAEVESQIRAAVLGKYGSGAPDVSKGGANPINQQETHELLKAVIPALKDKVSDFQMTVTAPADQKPEDFLYISNASLTVTVTRAEYNTGLWNY